MSEQKDTTRNSGEMRCSVADLALALHRRHCIDQIEMKRMQDHVANTTSDAYNKFDYDINELDISNSWASSGQLRAYWFMLAAEALAVMDGKPLKAIPKKIE